MRALASALPVLPVLLLVLLAVAVATSRSTQSRVSRAAPGRNANDRADGADGADAARLLFAAMADAFPASSLTARTAPRTAKEELLAAEASMSADQLIQHWGYPGERHSIPTEDGYLLTLQRIPWSRDAGQAEQAGQAAQAGQARPVVLLQHGLLQTADQWLLRGPGQDLALLMSDQGYDVWLGNFRGNTYCKNHMTMSKDNAQFWDFSWHENGFYDLAATIDYVLAVTGQPSLSYIGHSMGTTALLVLLATRPEYNRRVRVASLLAPVAYFSRPRGLTAMLFPITRKIEHDVRAVHMELLPLGSVPRSAVGALCRPGAPTATLCMAAYSHTTGPDPRQMNATLLPTVLSHVPAGSSLGQFVHYAQVQKSGLFRQYDHGVRGNTLRYGQPQPPLYNLSSVVAPVLFHYSTGDYLAHPKDVERLMGEVAGTAAAYKVPWKNFNHGDYMWAVDSYDLLYKTVLKSMREF